MNFVHDPAFGPSASTTRTSNTHAFKRLVSALTSADDRSADIASICAAIIVVCVAVPLAARLNIWIDEGFTLHSTGAGLGYAWREALEFEAQPPLYFLIEAAWRLANEFSIFFARLPSIFFAAAAAATIVRTAHVVAPRIPPAAIALITACNPLVIWAATEMRVYALVLLIGAVLVAAFTNAFIVTNPSVRACFVYTIVAVVGLYTQYYVGFFFVAQAITLVILRPERLRSFILSMAIVALAFLPFSGIALAQIGDSGGFTAHRSFTSIIHEILNDTFVYAVPHVSGWSGIVKVAGNAAVIALLSLVALAKPTLRSVTQRAMLVTLAWSVLIFSIVYWMVGTPYFVERHIIVIAPAALLSAIVIIDAASQRRTFIGVCGLIVTAAFTALTLQSSYREPTIKPGDWQRVAQTIAIAPRVPVAVFPSEIAVPLHIYRSGDIVPIPKPMSYRANYISTMALDSKAQVARSLDPIRLQSSRLWLVTTATCAQQPAITNYNCAYLDDYLTQWYHVEKIFTFRGSLLRLYATNSANRIAATLPINGR